MGQGAFLNDRPITISDATSVGHAMVMNNVGASRDAAFIRKTLNRTEVLLEHKVQVGMRKRRRRGGGQQLCR